MKCAIKDCENQVSLLCLPCHALISGEGLPSQAYLNSRRMIEAAVLAEREECAKVAEARKFLAVHEDSMVARFGRDCAAAIRARSEK